MSHMVIYRGSDGKPGYHQTDDIHDAVGFVEQMRNDQGVEHARIFRLEEVEFQYKPYYRVELSDSLAAGDLGPAGSGSVDASGDDVKINVNGEGSAPLSNGSSDKTLAPVTASADSAADADHEDPAEAGSRRGLFGR